MKTISLSFSLFLFLILSLTNLNAQKDHTQKDKKDIFKNGFFIDALFHAGYGDFTATYSSLSYAPISFSFYDGFSGGARWVTKTVDHKGASSGAGFRLGNKWYFGNGEKYRSGFTAIWYRADFQSFGNSTTSGSMSLLPNIGLINAFSLGPNSVAELNLNTGPSVVFAGESVFFGVSVNPNLKLRYKSFSVGLDINYIPTFTKDAKQNQFLQAGLTIGCKF